MFGYLLKIGVIFSKTKRYERILGTLGFPPIEYWNECKEFSFPSNPRFPCNSPTKG